MSKKKFPVEAIQKQLKQAKLDGWLLFDFHGHNTIALDLLDIAEEQLLSRRFYYWIPKNGTPLKIVHDIEAHTLKHLPGDQIAYESWQSLELALASTLRGRKRIAMEHSPSGSVPVISKLDSGTYEWLRSKNIDVVSSWPIAQFFISRWDKNEYNMHKRATKTCIGAYKSAWSEVTNAIKKNKTLTEYDLQQHILEYFKNHGFVTDHPPIVAIGSHASLPHYHPTRENSSKITKDELLLIDLWAKEDAPHSTYADITQVAYIGKKPPQELKDLYAVVYGAQQHVLSFLQDKLSHNQEVAGFELDDVCRTFINDKGYAKYFLHRTGHNIHTELHGLGPNLDNFETHDTRILQPRTCYSIEPGIYLPNSYGIRLECNIFIHETGKVEVTAKSLKHLPCLL